MALISRRRFLKGLGGFGAGTLALGSYAIAIEPGFMLDVTPYELNPPGWTPGLKLRVAVIADIHACEPFMPASRIRAICDLANSMQPDVTVILGDFNGGHNYVTAPVYPEQWGLALAALKAPLGVYAILGNHDWWHGVLPKFRGDDAENIRRSLHHARIKLLENHALRLEKDGKPFWLTGIGDQMAFRVRRGVWRGNDDLDGTLGQVTDEAPVLLLAHEPYVFHRVPKRISLTLCGHTHGGQVSLPLIGSPFAARRFGENYVYGHVVDDGRHMIISAGLGTSIFPARIGRPPELVMVEVGADALA